MKVTRTPLEGHVVIDTEPAADERGSFERLFRADAWDVVRPGLRFEQVNLSTTNTCGAVRGMHFQRPPAAEAKIIRCVRGRAFDVAIDLRRGSPTFLGWHATELSADEPREVFIPEGFAHGFQALTEDVQLLYFHTAPYARDLEGGVRYDDERLAIAWPLEVAQTSDRDRSFASIDEGFEGIDV